MYEAWAVAADALGLLGAGLIILAFVRLPFYRSHPADIIFFIALCDFMMVGRYSSLSSDIGFRSCISLFVHADGQPQR